MPVSRSQYRRFPSVLNRDDTMAEKIKVKLVKSAIGKNKKVGRTLRGLGLTKLNKTVELNNTPAIRGMINKVSFLVELDDVQ